MARKSRRRFSGGGINYKFGTNVKDIASFTPAEIPGLCFWIKADQRFLKRDTIENYANNQLFEMKDKLLDLFKVELKSKVITEIISDTPIRNSLVRVEDPNSITNAFPIFRDEPDKLATIDISNLKDPMTEEAQRVSLFSKVPIILPEEFSSYTISHGIRMKYIDTTNQIVLSSDYVETPTTTVLTSGEDEIPMAIPTAEFSEIIVYDRLLTRGEQQKLEGYLAYKENKQFNLPIGHPYLPTMMEIAALSPYNYKLNKAEDNLNQAVANIKLAFKESDQSTREEYMRNITVATAALSDIEATRTALSKGALVVGASTSIESILEAIRPEWLEMTPLNVEQLDLKISTYSNISKSLDDYTASVSQSHVYHMPMKGGNYQMEQEAKTEDYLLYMEQEVKSHEFYQKLRERSKNISRAGWNVYSPLYDIFKGDISIILEAFQHRYNNIMLKSKSLKAKESALSEHFKDNKWLELFPFFDTTMELEKFREPTLNKILATYNFIREQLYEGAYVCFQKLLDDDISIVKGILELANLNEIHPILSSTYIPFLKYSFKESEKYFKESNKKSEKIEAAIKRIENFFEIVKTTKAAPVAEFPDMVEQQFHISNKHVRRLMPIDTSLTGIEYVETNSDGVALEDGGEYRLVFPSILGWDFSKETFNRTILTKQGGETIQETYTILPPYEYSIMNKLPERLRPQEHTTDYEISREHVNKIHLFGQVNEPILLPKLALPNGSYFLIYSKGSHVIHVRNPGKPDSIDVIGPGEANLYVYTGYSEESETYYGRVPWMPNQIAYDTILNTPRTNMCAFVPEIKKFVYVRERKIPNSPPVIEPACTVDGYLVEVIKYKDGYVYDIDDTFHSNPYSITTAREQPLEKFALYKPPKNLYNEPIEIRIDSRTNAAILGNGILNEFGYCKIAQTVIQYINGGAKLRGAYGDIICNPSGAPLEGLCSRLEPFLSFKLLFRSRFIREVLNSNQYIFTTNAGIPILSPKGSAILVQSLSKESDTTFLYIEHGFNEVYLSDPVAIDTNCIIEEYPYKDMVIPENTVELAFDYYQQDKHYIETLLTMLSSRSIEIQQIGKEETTDIIQAIKKGVADLTKNLEEYEKYGPMFGALTKDIPITLDTFSVKFKKIIEDCYRIQYETDDALKFYMKVLGEIKDVEKNFLMLEGNHTILTTINKIQDLIQKEMKERGATSVPDVEEILQNAVKKRNDYRVLIDKLMNHYHNKPKYITEIHAWYKVAMEIIDDANDILICINDMYDNDVHLAIMAYNTNKKEEPIRLIENYDKEIRDINTRIEKIRKYAEDIDTLEKKLETNEERTKFVETVRHPYEQLTATLQEPIAIPPRGSTSDENNALGEKLKSIIDTVKPPLEQHEKTMETIASSISSIIQNILDNKIRILQEALQILKTKWFEIGIKKTAYETTHYDKHENELANIFDINVDIDKILNDCEKNIHDKQIEGVQSKLEAVDAQINQIDTEFQKIISSTV